MNSVRTRCGAPGEGDPCGPRRGRRGLGWRGCRFDLSSQETFVPPSSSSFESVRGGSSVAITAESVRKGSHSIIEATAILMTASVMSSDQSIALRCYYRAEARERRVFWAWLGVARKGLVLAIFPELVYITYIIGCVLIAH